MFRSIINNKYRPRKCQGIEEKGAQTKKPITGKKELESNLRKLQSEIEDEKKKIKGVAKKIVLK